MVSGTDDIFYLESGFIGSNQLQEEMVRHVLNYLYTVIVCLLALSLVLTAGSRVHRFLDAFDDLSDLGLSQDDDGDALAAFDTAAKKPIKRK